jgi:phytoene dehydrogenase-like protein
MMSAEFGRHAIVIGAGMGGLAAAAALSGSFGV